MQLRTSEAESLLPSLGLDLHERSTDTAVSCRIWGAGSLGHYDSLRQKLLEYENVTELIREADDILQYNHFLSVVEAPTSAKTPSFFVTAALSREEPRVLLWDTADLIIIGSYQSIYGVAWPTLDHQFTVATPEGGSIDQLCLCKSPDIGQILLAVADTAVRAISPTGDVLWVNDSDEIVVITSIGNDEIRCEPRVRGDENDTRSWALSVSSGKLTVK